jgi:hypothetical protein
VTTDADVPTPLDRFINILTEAGVRYRAAARLVKENRIVVAFENELDRAEAVEVCLANRFRCTPQAGITLWVTTNFIIPSRCYARAT